MPELEVTGLMQEQSDTLDALDRTEIKGKISPTSDQDALDTSDQHRARPTRPTITQTDRTDFTQSNQSGPTVPTGPFPSGDKREIGLTVDRALKAIFSPSAFDREAAEELCDEYNERAGIREHDRGLSKSDAEVGAAQALGFDSLEELLLVFQSAGLERK